ncbi:MAG: RnfABCDGE type electron transport complex subunit C [Deltaproteobacteria bacterium]|nr:RnfABCDGE type electron transport complex subunit C [Deltaproteobacteria bacterium]
MNMAKWLKGIRLARPPAAAAPPAELPAPERVYLPLRQHPGAPAKPQVQPGDTVAMGQIVGSSEEFEAANVLSSVSGKVEAVTQGFDLEGKPVLTVVVANDGKDTWWQDEEEVPMLADAGAVAGTRPSRLLKRLRQVGLVRAAAQGLPLHVELSPPMAPRSYLFMTGIPMVRAIDTLIIKAVDADPPVAPNLAALSLANQELAVGVAALARIAGTQRVVLAVPAGVELGELPATAKAREWEVVPISQTHYPFAADNPLIEAITGRVVPTPYGEPRDVGVLLEPLLTALDVGRILLSGKPVVDRLFSVAGDVAHPQTFRARLGTPVSEVLKAAGGPQGEMGKVILGGPMMGLAHFDLNSPVTKLTDGMYVQAKSKIKQFADHPCIHCGACVQACPVNLIPAELGKLCEYGHYEEAADKDLMHCVECGCCAYVCPAKRPMVHFLRLGKTEVLARRME